jgi:hypothetical protein
MDLYGGMKVAVFWNVEPRSLQNMKLQRYFVVARWIGWMEGWANGRTNGSQVCR